jgi:hypothetical protein
MARRTQGAIRSLDWPRIEAIVRDYGEYRLGLALALDPASAIPPAERTRAEQEESAAWRYALLQVVPEERQLQLGNRPDPDSGERMLFVNAPPWPQPEVLRGVVSEEEEEEDQMELPSRGLLQQD